MFKNPSPKFSRRCPVTKITFFVKSIVAFKFEIVSFSKLFFNLSAV
tara:strand:+ start:220 stop:357 length:138 start_codon:yes stop_codon:yes gene_type:complete